MANKSVEKKSSAHKGGRGHRSSLSLVESLRDQGKTEQQTRTALKAMGFSGSRVSQLIKVYNATDTIKEDTKTSGNIDGTIAPKQKQKITNKPNKTIQRSDKTIASQHKAQIVESMENYCAPFRKLTIAANSPGQCGKCKGYFNIGHILVKDFDFGWVHAKCQRALLTPVPEEVDQKLTRKASSSEHAKQS